MKIKVSVRFAFLMLFAALASNGCSTLSNTEKGVGIGGALGAGVGTAIGAATGNPKTGAVVGGLIGAGVGGAVGNEADERDADRKHQQQLARISQENRVADARRLGLIDVVQMHQSGTDPRVIVNQIRATGSQFNLSTADLNYLTEQRVPADVIVAMQQTQSSPQATVVPSRRYIVHEPIIYERPVYIAPPAPSFGVTYVRRR